MKNNSIIYNIIGLILIFGCGTKDSHIVADLPFALREVSGMAYNAENETFWMVNDSGNDPLLFNLNAQGEILKELEIDAKNKDWEDLTTDKEGNIYIGDFGNNKNKRKDLRILKIKKKDLEKESEEIKPVKISFEYPDQKKFPPKKGKRIYDCEAFFYLNGYLYLFTKSRLNKTSQVTKLYKIPAEKGHHKAEYLAEFDTCNRPECWVTSVDINNNEDTIALLTGNSVFIFTNFNSDNFFDADVKRLKFKHLSQKESVAFKNDSILYVADENDGINGGYLYEYSIN